MSQPSVFLINSSNRKPFSKAEYDKFNSMAFERLKEDFPDFYIDQPPENYGIDTFAYESEEAYKRGDAPLFAIELEAKKSGGWGKGPYPYSTVHFLARKAKNWSQPCVPFWVQYNAEGTNALVVPYPYIFNYPLKQMFGAKSYDTTGKFVQSNDFYYDIPLEACAFGRKNLQAAVMRYFSVIAGTFATADVMAKVNEIYRNMISPEVCLDEAAAAIAA